MHNQHPNSHPSTHQSHTPSPAPSPSNLPHAPKEPNHEGLKSILGTIILLVAAPLIAVLFTLFVFQSYEVDGPSMQNTLHNQDRLIVYKLPRTIARVTHHSYMPKRYDIIIFEKSDLVDSSTSGGNKQLVKRVIGLPGDRVVVTNNKIKVYNKEHPEGFDPDVNIPSTANDAVTPGNVDLVVPQGQIFVSGDNRTNSLDSRYFGTVPVNDVVGKLVLRLWPNTKTF